MKSKLSAAIAVCLLLACAANLVLAGDNTWTSNGPYGGVAGTFTFHPTKANIVFAGTGDGLFRSRNAGRTWQPLEIHVKVGPKVRIDPRAPGTILAFAGNIYRSVDEGVTWEQLSANPAPDGTDSARGLQDAEFHPTQSNVLFGASSNDGIFKSTDGGKTWVKKNRGIQLVPSVDARDASQVEIDPSDPNILYAALPGPHLYKSINGGGSWKKIEKGIAAATGVTGLMLDPLNPKTLYYSWEYGVYKTTDAGAEWTECFNSSNAYAIALDKRNPNNLYVVGHKAYRSTDAGNTWVTMNVALHGLQSVAVHPTRGNLVLAGGGEEGIYRSVNAGKSWAASASGLDSQDAWRLQCNAQRPKSIWATQEFNGLLFGSQDGGNRWELSTLSQLSDPVTSIGDMRVHPKNPDLLVAMPGTMGSVLAVSTDRGRTWALKGDPLGWGHTGGWIALDPKDEQTVYLTLPCTDGEGCVPMGVGKSTDLGTTWALKNKGLSEKAVSALTIDPTDRRVLYAGTSLGHIYKSTDAGETWKKSSAGLPTGEQDRENRVFDIAINRRDPRNIFVSLGGYLYKSTDAGHSWKPKPNVRGLKVIFDPYDPGRLFSADWGTVWMSRDDGETWSTFDSTGLPLTFVNDLLVDPLNHNRLIIGTGHGVFSYTLKVAPGAPVIDHPLPAAGKAGDAVTFIGSGFGSVQSTSKVLFGGVDVGTAQSWSDTSITTTVPAAATSGAIAVTILDKQSTWYEFIVLPSSGNVWPTTGPAAGGTRVTILAPEGLSVGSFQVLFGSALATDVRFTAPNIITCTAPPGTGTVDVKITTVLTTSGTLGTFTYQ